MNDFFLIHSKTSSVAVTSYYQILLPQTRVIGFRMKILNTLMLSECSGLPCVIKLTKNKQPFSVYWPILFYDLGRSEQYMLDSKRRTEIRTCLKGWYFEYNNQPFSFSSCIVVYCYKLYWPITCFWKHVEVLTPRLSGGEVVLQTYGYPCLFLSSSLGNCSKINIFVRLLSQSSLLCATILSK